MTSYIKKRVTCPCCNKDFEANLLKGFFSNGNMGLDHNPHSSAIFDTVVMCPHCGYSAKRFGIAVSENIKSYVFSDSFIFLKDQTNSDIVSKKLHLAASILSRTEQYKDAADMYLLWYWHSLSTDTPNSNCLHEAILHYTTYLENNADINTAMTYIDCLRQERRFAEAAETASSLSEYLQDEKYKQILSFEQVLIAAEDSNPHFVSEAFV